jgi:hypothetical protein
MTVNFPAAARGSSLRVTPLLAWSAVKITVPEPYRAGLSLVDRVRVGAYDASEGGAVEVIEPIISRFQYAVVASPATHRFNGSNAELQLVFADGAARLTVLAVPLRHVPGADEDPAVESLLRFWPSSYEQVAESAQPVSLAAFLADLPGVKAPGSSGSGSSDEPVSLLLPRVFHHTARSVTPPCGADIRWALVRGTRALSTTQFKRFRAVFDTMAKRHVVDQVGDEVVGK